MIEQLLDLTNYATDSSVARRKCSGCFLLYVCQKIDYFYINR